MSKTYWDAIDQVQRLKGIADDRLYSVIGEEYKNHERFLTELIQAGAYSRALNDVIRLMRYDKWPDELVITLGVSPNRELENSGK